MNPLVSIIIPTFSRPHNLSRAINSVLEQTYKPIEIIVVDDNGIGTESQQNTECSLKSYIEKKQITYIKHERNINGSAARNTGVKYASGSIIGLMDDDDIFLPTKIEEQVAALEKAHSEDSNYNGSYCNLLLVCDKIRTIQKLNKPTENLTEELLLGKSWFNSSTLLIYKNAYEEINGFDERFLRHQDWEFTIRFLSKNKMVLASPTKILVKKYKGDEKGNVIAKNPIKYIEIKTFFLTEMKPYIDALPNSNNIYKYQWLILVNGLFKAGLFKQGRKYIKVAQKFGNLSIHNIMTLLYACIKYYVKKVISSF